MENAQSSVSNNEHESDVENIEINSLLISLNGSLMFDHSELL